jgi:SAM-dependent methyltransferase
MNDIFLDEYSADAALVKYRRATAGHGISYLLDHDYGSVYRNVLENLAPHACRRDGIRLLEFGCGAGMNLTHVAAMVHRMGIPLAYVLGTDFSAKLIHAARADAAEHLRTTVCERLEFLVARNETIIDDIAAEQHFTSESMLGSFYLIYGVNTFRYCYRIDKENETVRQLFELLAKGGVCVVIDMNARCHLFRSQLKRVGQVQKKEFYIPTLEEYVRPFAAAGFQIVEARNFCWIPHSAGPSLLMACRILTLVLNVVASRYALRSLVVARKPD